MSVGKHRRPSRWNRWLVSSTAAIPVAVALTFPSDTQEIPVVPQSPEPTESPSAATTAPLTATSEPAPTTTPNKTNAPRTTGPSYGGVAKHVREVGWLLQDKFGVATVYGVGPRSNPSDHPTGHALDFVVSRAKGDQLAAYVLANAHRFRVKYVIWRQRINTGSGWRRMEDRGSVTANHYDHVHVSFR